MDIFDKIIAGELPCHKVYEDEETLAFLDIAPVSKGHTLVIPKKHAENLSEQDAESAMALMRTIHKIAPKIVCALGATGYNLGMNHGLDAGQDVMHTHLHIMPRYSGVPRSFEKKEVVDSELAKIAARIREEIAK